jgi:thioesterase domain-containing protein
MLMGYSVGGVMAYEAARQLIDQGEEIRQLILLDSACPALIPPFPLSLLDFFDSIDRFKGTDQNACNSEPPVAAIVNQARSANVAKKMTDPHVVATLRSLHKYTPVRMHTDQSPRTLLIAARHGIDRSRKVPRPDVNEREQKVIEWVLDDRSDFTPGGFGWDRLIDTEMIKVVPVDGNHFSVMTEPFVSTMPHFYDLRTS